MHGTCAFLVLLIPVLQAAPSLSRFPLGQLDAESADSPATVPPPLPLIDEEAELPATDVSDAASKSSGRRGGKSLFSSPLTSLTSSSRGTLPAGLAELFKNAYSSPGLKGDILYTARKHCKVQFSLDNYDHLKPSDVVMAEMHLYQIKPHRAVNTADDRLASTQARVSVHEVTEKGKPGKKLTSITRVLDSRLVTLGDSGWVTFDITTAIQGWLKRRSSNKGLEVWVESTQSGKQAARVARKIRFVKPNGKNLRHRPALVMYFKSQRSSN